jgi:hypothetical protein
LGIGIAHHYTPLGYSLVLEDGYYGLFYVAGYYKARVAALNANFNSKT